MNVVAIKFTSGIYKDKYYAGYRKNPASTLLGAQLYKTKKAALNIINKPTNFFNDDVVIVDVELKEV